MLSKVMKDVTSPFYEQASVPAVEQGAKDPSNSGSSSATTVDDSDSDTTGPSDVMSSISSSDDGDGDNTFKTAEPVEWN
jgi:hypothetical protein